MDILAVLLENGKTVSVPLTWVATVGAVLVAAIAVLWKDNLKLRAIILKEKEEKIAVFSELRKMAEEKRRRRT